jgi:hypothetical protein
MYYIGIVTGEETGIAVWDSVNRKINSAQLVDFWECIAKLKRFAAHHENVKVILKSVPHKRNHFKEFDTYKIMQDARIKAASRRDFTHLINYCDDVKIEYETAEFTDNVWDIERMRLLTGIDKRIRKQVKEAVQLVWGK